MNIYFSNTLKTKNIKNKILYNFMPLLLFVICAVTLNIYSSKVVYAIECIEMSLSTSAPKDLSGTYLSPGRLSTLTLKLKETESIKGSFDTFLGLSQKYSSLLTMATQPIGGCETFTQFGKVPTVTVALPPVNIQYSIKADLQWFFREEKDSWELNCMDGCLMEAQLVGDISNNGTISASTNPKINIATRPVGGLGVKKSDNYHACGYLWVDGLDPIVGGINIVLTDESRKQLEAGCIEKGDQLSGIGSVIFELAFDLQDKFNTLDLPKGEIKGQLKSSLEISTPDDNDVQNATVALFRQEGFVSDKKPNELFSNFQESLKKLGRKQVGDIKKIEPDDKGKFSFKDLPLITPFSLNGATAFRPAYYTVEVTGGKTVACTDCVKLKDGKVSVEGTETVHFSNNVKVNTKPDTKEPVEHKILLTPLDGIDKKMELVIALGTSTMSPNNYKPVEAEVERFLEKIKEGKQEITPELAEGLQRAILAETVVLDGAMFADSLLKLMLKGLGTVLADVFDDLANSKKDGKTAIEKDIKFTKTKIEEINKGKWKISDPAKALKQFEQHQKKLEEFKKVADKIDALSKNIKLLVAATAELVKKDDKEFFELVNKGLNIVFRTVKSFVLSQGSGKSAALGGAQGLVKIAIEEGVNASFPFVFDDIVLPSYAKNTAPFLQNSVNLFIGNKDKSIKPWDGANPEKFSTDNTAVSEVRLRINKAANDAIIDIIKLQAASGALDFVQDALETAATFTKQPYLKVLEKIAQAMKYIGNAESARIPFNIVFNTIEPGVQEGTLKAFGQDVPSSASKIGVAQTLNQNNLRNASFRKSSINPRLFTNISESGNKLIESLNQLSGNLADNNIGAALELTGGDSPDGYINNLTEWELSILLFLTQASGTSVSDNTVNNDLSAILANDVELKMFLVDLEQKIANLYFNVMTLAYEGPEDPLYAAERNSALSSIDFVISRITRFEQSFNNLNTVIGDTDLLPAIAIQSLEIISAKTGSDAITLSPEDFTLRAHIKNISAVPVLGLSAELTAISPNDSVTISPTLDTPINIGTLDGDDGAAGSGPDETDIEWKVTYEGDLGAESIFFSVNILEEGDEPLSFVTNETQNALIVDPSVSDKDLDFMPDDWEKANGLDTTKDDAREDKDNDGLINLKEFELGSDPQKKDTDGDGLSDEEETTGGADGFVTNPLNADTDNDGASDSSDGQPVDGGATEKPKAEDIIGEPEVAVDKTEVGITNEKRVATVSITNSGEGALAWSAVSGNNAVATTSPNAPDFHNGDGLLIISAPAHFDFEAPGIVKTIVKVFDAAGATKDFKEITVKLGSGEEQTPPEEAKPTPEPTKPTQPPEKKSFTFKCINNFQEARFPGAEKLVLQLGETESCALTLTNLQPGVFIDVATKQRTGFKSSINVDPANGATDSNGEIKFNITAVKKGVDWIAWAVKNDKGKFEFNKKAYNSGRAWGMFVEVE